MNESIAVVALRTLGADRFAALVAGSSTSFAMSAHTEWFHRFGRIVSVHFGSVA